MSFELLGPLVVLALIDSTSFGTLLIPIWLLLAPARPRPARILLFLGTVAIFYLALGVLIVGGLNAFTDEISALLDARPFRVGQLVLGGGLMIAGLTIEPWTKEGKAKKAARRAAREPGRLQRWRARVVEGPGSAGGVMSLAVAATAIEAASMLPYLAAMGILAASGLALWESTAILVGYCFVMVVPALILLSARVGFDQRVAPYLRRIEGWMTRNAGEMTAWVLFLVGLYIAGGAAEALWGGTG